MLVLKVYSAALLHQGSDDVIELLVVGTLISYKVVERARTLVRERPSKRSMTQEKLDDLRVAHLASRVQRRPSVRVHGIDVQFILLQQKGHNLLFPVLTSYMQARLIVGCTRIQHYVLALAPSELVQLTFVSTLA